MPVNYYLIIIILLLFDVVILFPFYLQELQAEVNKLRRALFDYQVASVAAMSDQQPNPQSPPASQEQTYPPDSHFYENIDDLTGWYNNSIYKRKLFVLNLC